MTRRALEEERLGVLVAELPDVKQRDAHMEARRDVLKIANTVHVSGLSNLFKFEVLRDLGHAGAMNDMEGGAVFLEARAESALNTIQQSIYLRAADHFRAAVRA